jgi:hypothetical protein
VEAQVIQLGIGVMGHESRREAIETLTIELDAIPAVTAAEPSRAMERYNGDAAWRYAAAGDWTIVLQDDAVPIEGFRKHAAAALENAPRTAVSFYVGTGKPYPQAVQFAVDKAERIGASWLEAEPLLWGVAVAMPTEEVEPFLAWADGLDIPYDRRIGAYFRQVKRQPVRYTWPSLVDHADGPSLVHGRKQVQRVAHEVGVGTDWAGPIVKISAPGD